MSLIGGATYLEMLKKPISARIKDRVFRHINILNWLPQYTKQDAIGDMTAGITLGLTMMPQSIAYATLTGLSPQVWVSAVFVSQPNYLLSITKFVILWLQKQEAMIREQLCQCVNASDKSIIKGINIKDFFYFKTQLHLGIFSL